MKDSTVSCVTPSVEKIKTTTASAALFISSTRCQQCVKVGERSALETATTPSPRSLESLDCFTTN